MLKNLIIIYYLLHGSNIIVIIDNKSLINFRVPNTKLYFQDTGSSKLHKFINKIYIIKQIIT